MSDFGKCKIDTFFVYNKLNTNIILFIKYINMNDNTDQLRDHIISSVCKNINLMNLKLYLVFSYNVSHKFC